MRFTAQAPMFALPRSAHLLASGLALGLLAGCGAGGGVGPGTPSHFLALSGAGPVDGFVTSGGFVASSSLTNAVAVGDNAGNEPRRGFLRFDVSGIPAGATILSAVLRVSQVEVVGLPYALGDVRVDHVLLGADLDPTDFASAPLFANVGTLSADATLGERTLDVTARVAADRLALRVFSDFRLRMSALATDFDGLLDTARFEDAENNLGTGQVPALIVTYQLP